jgi:hypothetical protein
MGANGLPEFIKWFYPQLNKEGLVVDVVPDIEVENDAASVLAGRDPQLERAVAEVMKLMATKRHTLPGRLADKVRARVP